MSDDNNTPKPSIPGVIPGATPAGADADNTTRTVRLKPISVPPPVAAPPSITAPIPGADPIPDGPRPPTQAQVQAAKSKTSRISLEQAITMDSQTPRSTQNVEPATVLSAPSAAAAPGAPRTIRLKRPTEMPTLKVNAVPPPSALPGDASAVAAAPQAPAAADDADAAVTQKRTLKVRRPGAPAISIGGAPAAKDGEPLPEGMEPVDLAGMTPLLPMAPPEKGNAVFVTFAFIGIIAAAVLVGFFAWQLFGSPAIDFRFNV